MNTKRFLQLSASLILILAAALPAQAQGSSSLSISSEELLWAKGIGGQDDDHGFSITMDTNDNAFITGSITGTVDFDPGPGTFNLSSAGESDIFITKLDRSGNFQWARIFGGPSEDYGSSIAVDSGGNIYTTGQFEGTADFDPGQGTTALKSSGSADIFLSKLDSSGNFSWARRIGGTGCDGGQSLAVDSNGNVYLVGHFSTVASFDPNVSPVTLTSAGDYDMFITKFDPGGNLVWARRIGGTSADFIYGIALDPGGNIYTTGYFSDGVDFDPGAGTFSITSAGKFDAFVTKLDSNGNFLWAKSMGGTNADEGNSISIDHDGNIYLAGSFMDLADFNPGVGTFNLTSAGNWDVFVSKLDKQGNFLWAKRMGGLEADRSLGMVVGPDGDIYATGLFYGSSDFDPGQGEFSLISAGNADIFLSRLNSSGNFSWARRLGGIGNDGGSSIAVLPGNTIYTTGFFEAAADFDPGPSTYNLQSRGEDEIFVASILPNPKARGANTVGVFRPNNGLIFLKNSNTSGFADLALNYGLGGDSPVVGDWDGNGSDTIGVYRGSTFLLRNSNVVGYADLNFAFGQPGDQPIAGDWDGDGVDTIGVYRPSSGQFLLRNSNDAGPADISFYLGNVGDVGIAGDWNGDGIDTVGVFRPSNGVIFLKNTNESGFAEIALNYGLPGDRPVVGDWNGDGKSTIAVYRNAKFYLRNLNTNGFADIILDLGIPGDMPIAGNWDGEP